MEDCCCSVCSMAAWYCPNTMQKLDSKPSRKKIFFSQNGELHWICIGFNYYYGNTMSYYQKLKNILLLFIPTLDKLFLLFCMLGLRIVSYLICFFVSHVFLWAWWILHKLKVAVHMHTVPKNEKNLWFNNHKWFHYHQFTFKHANPPSYLVKKYFFNFILAFDAIF